MKSRTALIALLAACACACSRGRPMPPGDDRSVPTAPPSPPPAQSLLPPAGDAATPAEPAALEGKDFIEEAKRLYRVAACAGDAPVPPDLDAAVVEAHCKEILPKIDAYRTHYVDVARPYLTALEPAGLPSTVVYPFGGGDLATAITTYPNATEINTVSLELVGDPRRVRGMEHDDLKRSLYQLRTELAELFFTNDFSNSETLKRTQHGNIPGELAFFLVGLSVHGYEPVHVRYFKLLPDGSIHYLTTGEIEAEERQIAEHLKASWTPPDFSVAFSSVEIAYQPRGAPPGTKPRIHRHIAANLADDHLAKDPSLLRYLESRGPVSAMTKAASYLLWTNGFSQIRNYLLDHMVFMLSDSTGIPPAFVQPAGFEQETHGFFWKSLLGASTKHNADFRALWAKQPIRKLPFRYGYKDSKGSYHLVVTRKVPKPAPP